MKKLLSVLIVLTLIGFFAQKAEAIPGYARNMETGCSECHTVYPLLNDYGKKFQEMGKPLNQTEVADGFSLSSDAFSVRLNLRPVDKRFSKNTKEDALGPKDKQLKTRGLHEAEIFMAGRSGNASYFLELESEDEWPADEGLQVNLVMGYVGYHVTPELNFYTGLISPFVFDGNNTVSRDKSIRKSWAASKFVPGVSQMIGMAGRVLNDVTYSVALHGTDDDFEGHDPKYIALRTAVDVGTGLTIGGYFDTGREYDEDAGQSVGDSVKLYGVDASLNYGNFSLDSIYGIKDVKGASGNDSVVSMEMNYMITQDDKPWITPVFQINRSTKKAGKDVTVDGALAVIYNITEPLRITGSVEQTLVKPNVYRNKETRAVIAIDLAF